MHLGLLPGVLQPHGYRFIGKIKTPVALSGGDLSLQVSESPFVAANGMASGVPIIHLNPFRPCLQLWADGSELCLGKCCPSGFFFPSIPLLSWLLMLVKTAINLPPAFFQLFNTCILFLLVCLCNNPIFFSPGPSHQRFPKLLIVFWLLQSCTIFWP